MEEGKGGMVKGWVSTVWYSSTLMSLVSVRALRPRAAGGKVGMVKVWRGIWAPCACEGSTGSPGGRVGALVAILEERSLSSEVREEDDVEESGMRKRERMMEKIDVLVWISLDAYRRYWIRASCMHTRYAGVQ